MNHSVHVCGNATGWEDEIRALEAKARIAFLAADAPALDRLWADGCVVNSPLQQVLEKRRLLELLQSGRIGIAPTGSRSSRWRSIARHARVVAREPAGRVRRGRPADFRTPGGAMSRTWFTPWGWL